MSFTDTYLAGKSFQVQGAQNSRPYWKTVDSKNAGYFSGQDAAIYFEDLYIGEIINLQYQLQEAVYPLKGYADYTKQAALHGARQVAGSFTVNFQQALLFWMILEHLRNVTDPSPSPAQSASKSKKTALTPGAAPILNSTLLNAADSYLVPSAATTFQEAVQVQPKTTLAQTMASYATRIKSGQVASLQQGAAQLKQKWNWTSEQASPLPLAGGSLLQTVLQSIQASNFQSHFDTPIGFTLAVFLGDIHPKDYKGVYSGNGVQAYSPEQLQAADAIDNSDVDAALSKMPPWSVTKITGVEITGFGMAIDDSGRPLLQTYDFIASDVLPGDPYDATQ